MLISSSLIADVSFKIIFVGDSDVGKSALINRFKNDTFESNSRPTIGVEFAKRIVNFRRSNQNIQIHLWDTAGQERYKSITKQHYRGADSALIIFDLDKPTSFASTIQWINEARDNSPPNCIIGLVGNKADISNEISREVSREALRFALENRILYFETSARWNRAEETDPDRPYSKGVENVIFDTIENVGILNPRKAISVQEKDSQFDGEEEGVTIGSMYELTRTQISLNNPFADTLPSGLNLKGSSALLVKEVKTVNLNIRSEKPAENTGCSCT